ncbi:hypothetical protein IGI04_035746 [Brassica rapa subsp. trilocularis]|uniref:Exocyst subunit Exo70 family protein n=1 Tax=Brassica rapa subsp. trilocularis TaxID=1813537 RepID=A0ABQ7LG96_BRACM|nr:hypothetical protein IGI04_035746 [Brassica rapa subsp. trilocularis]
MDIQFGVLMFKEIIERLESSRKTSGRLMEDICKTYERLMEDFDLGGKPKLFQNLGGNHTFYLNLGGMRDGI